MIAVVLLLLALALGIVAVLVAHVDAGYVLISYGPWVAETSLVVLVLGVALWALLIYGLGRLLLGLLHLPGALREALDRRREQRARHSFEAGLRHLLEGHWQRAEVELVRHAADRESPQLNYLAAARAAQRLGAGERRDHYLNLATDSAPAAASERAAVLVTRAELQRERGEHAAVKATALELRGLDNANPYAIELLAEALAELGEWAPLYRLLQEPPATVLDPRRRQPLRRRALQALMQEALAAGSLDQLKATWSAAEDLREDVGLRLDYARGLLRLGADAEALALTVQTLDDDWNAGFARLAGQLHANDPLALLAHLERWLQRYGERPELLAAAGHACVDNRLWGKARSYLDAVLRVAPSPQAYLDLARLAEQTQRPDEAAQHYRDGLALSIQHAVER